MIAHIDIAREELRRAIREWAQGDPTRILQLNANVFHLPIDTQALVMACGFDLTESPGLHPRDIVRLRRASKDSADRAIAEELAALLGDEACIVEPEASKPFPLDLLPPVVRTFTIEAARSLGCDPAMVAVPALVACASAIGLSRTVRIKRGWSEPAIIWGAIVAPSGALKTPAMDVALRPVRQRQAELLREHEAAMKVYDGAILEHEKRLSIWKKGGAGAPPEKPERPVAARLMTSDATIEGLSVILAENPKGIAVVRDELSGWIGGFDRYARGQSDAAAFLELHKRGFTIYDRKSTERRTVTVEGAVSIVGSIQPGALKRAIGERHLENGLLPRFLLAMPPPRRRRWTDATVPEDAERDFAQILEELWTLEPGTREDGSTYSIEIDVTPEGKAIFVEFVNAHGEEEAGLDEDLGAAWRKLEGYALRLALIHYLMRWGSTDKGIGNRGPIDEESLAAGCGLALWFSAEARRVYGMLAESEEETQRRKLLQWIRQRPGGEATVRDVCRGLRVFRGKSEAAENALRQLAKDGHGQLVPTEHEGPGRPTEVFVLRGAQSGDGDEIRESSRKIAILSPSPPRAGPESAPAGDDPPESHPTAPSAPEPEEEVLL